jgi:cation diffusion facilitator family transporter
MTPPLTHLGRWAWGSVAVNVVLAALHGLVAAASGSLGVTAELVHNVADLLAAAAVLLGLKLAARKSPAFPYGLYKVENLVAAGLAGMVFLTAYEIARDALLGAASPVRVDAWMLAVLVATLAIPLTFSRFELRAGQAANSPALIADAREYRVHVFTTGLVFVSLVSEWSRFRLDRVAAVVIGVVIAKTGWDLLADAMRVLLDASLDTETLRRIRAVIDGDPAVAEVMWVTGRNAGRFRFVEAGVVLRGGALTKVEAVVPRIEAGVRAAVGHVERVLIHVERATSASIRYAVPLADASGTISPHFGDAPSFALVTVRRADGAVEAHEVIGNPWRGEERAKGIRVAEWLVAHKVDVVLLKEDVQGKGPAYVLRDAGVEERRTDAMTVFEALAACRGKP